MAVGEKTIIDSITTATGDSLSLVNERIFENTFTYRNIYTDQDTTVTNFVDNLDLIANGKIFTLVHWEETSGVESEDGSEAYASGGELFGRNEIASHMDVRGPNMVNYFDGFSDSAIIARVDYGSYTDAGGHPSWEMLVYAYAEYSVIWDEDRGLLGDDEWRLVAVANSWDPSEDTKIYLTRWVDGEVEKIDLWQETWGYYTQIDHKPLSSGSYLAGAVYESYENGYLARIGVDLVDQNGNVQTWTQTGAIDGLDTADGQIIEASDGTTAYVVSYLPTESTYGGADGYQTDLVFVVDGQLKALTLSGADLLADDITGLDLSDDGTSVLVTYTDAAGVALTQNFNAYWDAGLLSLSKLSDRHTGTSGNDTMILNDISEKVWALGGDEYIDSGAGNDTIFGGAGADTFLLDPGFGSDRIKDFSVGEGDRLDVSQLADAGMHVAAISPHYNGMHQEIGITVSDFDSGKLLAGLRGNLTAAGIADSGITGAHDADGNRVFWAAAELGNTGAAKVTGTSGADLITTETGQKIHAGAGADVIVIEETAMAWGDAGEDLFVLRGTNGHIRDFETGSDVIDLSGWDVESLDDLTLSARLTGKGTLTGDLLISDGEHVLRLDGVSVSELSADDFIFA